MESGCIQAPGPPHPSMRGISLHTAVEPKAPESKFRRRLELASFLTTRRARLTPTEVGLPKTARRRVAGLRREEVAELAGIGVAWYTWLEQGRPVQASAETLDKLAQALQLGDSEREYLFALAGYQASPFAEENTAVPISALRMLSNLELSPAYITNLRWDLLAWNPLASAVFGDFDSSPKSERNLLRMTFTNPALRRLFTDWEGFARCMVNHFRADYAQWADHGWSRLAASLRQTSPIFRDLWEQHDVTKPVEWHKELNHPTAGRLVFDSLTLAVQPIQNLRVVIYTPANQETRDNLQRLPQVAEESASA